MDTPRARLHPALWVAAISVTALSLAGIGAIMGWIPAATSSPAHAASLEAPAATLAAVAPQAGSESLSIAEPKAVPDVKPALERAVRAPLRRASVRARTNPEPIREAAAAPVEEATAVPVPARTEATVLAQAPEAVPARRHCAECGTVESVREIKQAGEGSGLGAVAGGVLGGLLGHQIGKGRGNTVATVAGAVGGAVAGHQVERQVKSTTRHEVTVRMEDGSTRTVGIEGAPVWRAGDRVRLVDGRLLADN
ncbi:MAG: glycine zipper 2TM domain-containing protein [Rhodocyclaceae bacterium]